MYLPARFREYQKASLRPHVFANLGGAEMGSSHRDSTVFTVFILQIVLWENRDVQIDGSTKMGSYKKEE